MDWLMENWAELMKGLLSIVGGAAVLAAMTKHDWDNYWVGRARKFLEFLGANVGHAKSVGAAEKEKKSE